MSTAVLVVLLVLGFLILVVALRKKPPQLPEAPQEKKLSAPDGASKATSQAPASPTKTAKRKGESKPPLPEDVPSAPKEVPDRVPPELVKRPSVAPKPPRVEEEDITVDEVAPAAPPRRKLEPRKDLQAMRKGLAKSRESTGFFGRLLAIFGGKKEIGQDVAEQIEELLLTSDVGVQTTETILGRVRDSLGKTELVDSDRVWSALRQEATRILSVEGKAGPFPLSAKPTVVLMVGVNGSGKTTTIGKLATRLKSGGLECVLAAGDTFRAAAVQQLVVWGERVGCEVVKGKEGADPGSVVFDAIKRAQEIGADVVLADTAGRLHTKSNLMAEMKKIAKTADKALPGAPHEVLLVIDATNGQNALAQAKEFKDALDLSGIVLTKLDGTAKGGMVLGICDNLALPVRFIGLGERPNDLHDFVPEAFVEALLGNEAVGETST